MKKHLKHMILIYIAVLFIMAMVPMSVLAASKPKVAAKQAISSNILKMVYPVRDVIIEGLKPGDVIYDLKNSNKKVLTAKIYGSAKDGYNISMVPKKAGKTKISFKIKRGSKTWSYSTTVTFYKYSNPAKLIKLGNTTLTSKLNTSGPFGAQYQLKKKFSGTIKVTPKSGWKVQSIKHISASGKETTKKNGSKVTIGKNQGLRIAFYQSSTGATESFYISYN